MSVVTASTLIAAPRERVWTMVMDPARLHDWVTIHRKLVHADDGRPRIGFEMDQQIHLRGVSVEVHWRLVECEPGDGAVWAGRGAARSGAGAAGPAAPRAGADCCWRGERGGALFAYPKGSPPPLGPVGALASRALV